MLKRLAVSNFMSIGSAELELAPFTVIVGRNRSGKSSMLRALHALCFNDTGNEFITHGKSSCSVEVETAEGDVVRWDKNKTTAKYELNGNTYSKLGGSVPADITDSLGIREVVVDNTTTLTPQLHAQSEFYFLVDKSSGQAAKALARMTRLDLVVRAQVDCKQTQRIKKDALKATAAQLERIRVELAKTDLPALRAREELIEELLDRAEAVLDESALQCEAERWLERYRENLPDGLTLPSVTALSNAESECNDMLEVLRLLSVISKIVPAELGEFNPLLDEEISLAAEAVRYVLDSVTAQREITSFDNELKLHNEAEEAYEKQLKALVGQPCPVCGGVLI